MTTDTPNQPIDELRQEIETTWDTAYNRMQTLQVEIDRLKLEITALKTYLREESSAFHTRYAEILDEILRRLPPE